jgi:hypothetical protein
MSYNGFRGRVSQVRILPGPLSLLPDIYALLWTTLDIYIHVVPSLKREAASATEEVLA